MGTHHSIRRTALGGIASTVIAFGVGSVAAQAQEAIRVGVSLTQSPPGAVIQGTEVLRGLEIARDLFNEEGGVLDRPIELIVEDSQGIPERGRAAAEKLITSDDVVAITGGHQSSVCLAEIGLAARHNVPYINTNCWSDDIRKEGHRQVFNPNMYNARVASAMAEVIAGLDIDSVFGLAENTDWGIGQAEALGELLEKTGADISYQWELLDREARDFTPVVQGLRGADPDLVALIMLPPAAYVLVNQLHEQGVVPSEDTWLFEGGGLFSYPDFWENVREGGAYAIYFDLYHTDMALSDFGTAVREEYVQRHDGTPSRLVFQAADSLLLIKEAIENAGGTDPDAMIEWLQQAEVEGTRGVITFSDEEGPLFQQWVDTPFVTFQVTEVDQTLEETTLISAPDIGVQVDQLRRPGN
jgi:branched-chain amino acid transport system substrate-binding protein